MPEHGNVCFRISCSWISCLSRHIYATNWRKLVAKREFNNTMDKQAVKVVKDDEMVGHLPRKFSRIVWYFLARSGDCTVERNQCWSDRSQGMRKNGGSMAVEFNSSNKVKMKLLKELLACKSWFRTVLKILTNGSFRSHRKQWSTTGFVMFNLCLLKVFSSICDNNKSVYSTRKEWSRV